MTAADIGIKRLKTMTAFDEGFSNRELTVIEREVKSVLAKFFEIDNKDVEIAFSKRIGEITISIRKH